MFDDDDEDSGLDVQTQNSSLIERINGLKAYIDGNENRLSSALLEKRTLENNLNAYIEKHKIMLLNSKRYEWLSKQRGWPETEDFVRGLSEDKFNLMIDGIMSYKQ